MKRRWRPGPCLRRMTWPIGMALGVCLLSGFGAAMTDARAYYVFAGVMFGLAVAFADDALRDDERLRREALLDARAVVDRAIRDAVDLKTFGGWRKH